MKKWKQDKFFLSGTFGKTTLLDLIRNCKNTNLTIQNDNPVPFLISLNDNAVPFTLLYQFQSRRWVSSFLFHIFCGIMTRLISFLTIVVSYRCRAHFAAYTFALVTVICPVRQQESNCLQSKRALHGHHCFMR
jgi:hypothetical protein